VFYSRKLFLVLTWKRDKRGKSNKLPEISKKKFKNNGNFYTKPIFDKINFIKNEKFVIVN